MRLLLTVYSEYKRNQLVTWINQKLNFTEDPEVRLKLLKVKNKLFSVKLTPSRVIRFEEIVAAIR